MKKSMQVLFGVIFFAAAVFSAEIKNAVILIPDGMSPEAAALARLYKGEPLNIEAHACAMVRTYQAEGPITDSASAATAMATGFKTNAGFIACLPEKGGMPGIIINKQAKRAPVATLFEAARLAGKATGIVATSNVQHATPAAFTAHYPDRNAEEIIAEQQVYAGLDVVLGGGSSRLTGRKDAEDLTEEIIAAGYDYVIWPGRMRTSSAAKLWGMFAAGALKYELDRNPDAEPSLSEMTKKAIEVLSKDADGFLLMVEGSKIDWAAHANDPAGLISDMLSFDEAAAAALEFAAKDGKTIVLAVSDHCTGGLSIGGRNLEGYDKAAVSAIVNPLKKAKKTGEGIFRELHKDRSNLKQVFKEFFGITDLTTWEESILLTADYSKFNYAAGPILSRRANIGWSTSGHTGGDVTLYCYHPGGIRPSGVIDNTEIAVYIEKALGLDLKEATERLFVPVSALPEGIAPEASSDGTENPVLVLKKGALKMQLPANKNYALVEGKKRRLNGVTIYNGKQWYVPGTAVNLMAANTTEEGL